MQMPLGAEPQAVALIEVGMDLGMEDETTPFQYTLQTLGSDGPLQIILPLLPLESRRAIPCTNRATRSIASQPLQTSALCVGHNEHGSPSEMIARLEEKLVVKICDIEHDLVGYEPILPPLSLPDACTPRSLRCVPCRRLMHFRRALPPLINLFGRSVHEAFWLGAAAGDRLTKNTIVRLASGHELHGPIRREQVLKLDTMLSAADIAFLRGVLAHDSNIGLEEAHQVLKRCANKNAFQLRRSLNRQTAVMVKQAVAEVQAWAHATARDPQPASPLARFEMAETPTSPPH